MEARAYSFHTVSPLDKFNFFNDLPPPTVPSPLLAHVPSFSIDLSQIIPTNSLVDSPSFFPLSFFPLSFLPPAPLDPRLSPPRLSPPPPRPPPRLYRSERIAEKGDVEDTMERRKTRNNKAGTEIWGKRLTLCILKASGIAPLSQRTDQPS